MKATVSRLIVLLLAIGEVFTSLSAIALAGGPPPGKPARPQAAPATTQPNPNSNSEKDDLPPRFPLPSARVGAVNGIVTIKLINNSNVPIQYQLIGGTRQELLAKNATIQVQGFTPNYSYLSTPGWGIIISQTSANFPRSFRSAI
ncbi:MAG: hypothetical protein RSE13_19785 [Planktothrix sp. GU0601_MAG3]|nr:MAG: hypothetical protein RSE13_19785 [Planktothrix sp. GU0601_MAG3]